MKELVICKLFLTKKQEWMS